MTTDVQEDWSLSFNPEKAMCIRRVLGQIAAVDRCAVFCEQVGVIPALASSHPMAGDLSCSPSSYKRHRPKARGCIPCVGTIIHCLDAGLKLGT
jgi:hypothetical protein